MLFNSYVFLLAFLPAALVLHGLVARAAPKWRLPLLVLLSFVFYGWWDLRFVPLLGGSILVNWLVARAFGRRPLAWLIPAAIAATAMWTAIVVLPAPPFWLITETTFMPAPPHVGRTA